MKKLSRYAVILVLGLGMWACTDMLDQVDPTGPTGEDFFATETDLQQAVVAAYSGLSSANSLYNLGIVGFEQFSDNVYSGSSTTDGAHATWTSFSYDPQNTNVLRVYEGLYQLINQCNQVVVRGPEAEVSPEVLAQALGEVRFLRGFAHFMLTLIWGDAVVMTEIPSDPAGFAPLPSSAAEVYAQAIADLQFAEANLSDVPAQAGRVTSWTAKAMLAYVYLFGADELGRSEWYSLSQAQAAEVIANGPYGLFDDLPTPAENLQSIFQTFNENGEELIFSVNHFNGGGNWSDGDVATQVSMAMNPRQMRSNNNMWGYGWAYVYEAIAQQWDDADARKDYCIWFQGEQITVNGDSTGSYNQSGQNRCCARPKGMGFQKFWYQESGKNINGQSTLDFPVLRYAELLLIHAEADLLADGSLSAEGLASINEVRARAGLPALTNATIDDILAERRWELFGEGKRWFDFVRKRTSMPGLFTEATAAIVAGDTDNDDNDFAAFNAERHFKLPYPQAAIDRNPNLVQKPAWVGN